MRLHRAVYLSSGLLPTFPPVLIPHHDHDNLVSLAPHLGLPDLIVTSTDPYDTYSMLPTRAPRLFVYSKIYYISV